MDISRNLDDVKPHRRARRRWWRGEEVLICG